MLRSAHIDVSTRAVNDAQMLTGTYREYPIPKEWFVQAATYYDVPLIVRVPGLDPQAQYRPQGHLYRTGAHRCRQAYAW